MNKIWYLSLLLTYIKVEIVLINKQANRKSIPIPEETMEYLKLIAKRDGITTTKVIQKLITKGLYLEYASESGKTIVERDPNGKERVLASGDLEIKDHNLLLSPDKHQLPKSTKARTIEQIEQLIQRLRMQI